MSELNPFQELDSLPSKDEGQEKNSLKVVKRDIEGSYNMSRDIFTAVSTLTDKLFTVFSGVIDFFDTQEERFIESNQPKDNPEKDIDKEK